MSLPLSSFVVVFCFGLGFVSLSPPVQSLPLKTITQVNSASTAQDFFNQGVKRLQQGDYDKLGDYQKAITDYDRAINLNPNFSQAISNRKIVQNKLRTPQQSTFTPNVITQSSSNPSTAEDFFNRGVEKYDKADFDGAIVDFSQAIRLNPNSAEAYHDRGVAYSKLGESQKAIADYNQAIRLNPNLAEAYNNRGATYGKLGESQKAIADYNQAIVLNPNLAEAYNNRGATYSNLGESQKAIADFNQIIRLNPNYAEAYYIRGLNYLILGESQKAIADLQRAATLFQQQGNTAKVQEILDFLKKFQQ